MNFSFHPEAEEEFELAVAYYDESAPGLGFTIMASGETVSPYHQVHVNNTP